MEHRQRSLGESQMADVLLAVQSRDIFCIDADPIVFENSVVHTRLPMGPEEVASAAMILGPRCFRYPSLQANPSLQVPAESL